MGLVRGWWVLIYTADAPHSIHPTHESMSRLPLHSNEMCARCARDALHVLGHQGRGVDHIKVKPQLGRPLDEPGGSSAIKIG